MFNILSERSDLVKTNLTEGEEARVALKQGERPEQHSLQALKTENWQLF